MTSERDGSAAEEVVRRVRTGELSIEGAARSLAAISLAPRSERAVAPRIIGRGQREGEATVLVDCGTTAMARLIRHIDSHGGLGSIIEGDGTVSSDGGASSGRIELRQPCGEPLDRLVNRLGSSPPPVLVEAWKRQLAELQEHLRDARLPLHHAVPEDLRVDSSARLHIAFLPLHIATSICEAEPRCRELGSLAPWFHVDRVIDLRGIDEMAEAIASVAVPSLSSRSNPLTATSRRSNTAPTGAGSHRHKRQLNGMRSPRRPRQGTPWAWTCGLAALIAVAATAFWWTRAGESAGGEKGLRQASQASNASTAEATPTADAPSDAAAPESDLSLIQLPVVAEGFASDWQTDPGALDFDAFAEPAIDLAREGFEATGDAAASWSKSEEQSERAEPFAADIDSVAEAADRFAIDLPPRGETAPVALPGAPAIEPAAWAAAELQMPSGETPWGWIGGGVSAGDDEVDQDHQRRWIGMRGGDGSERAIALLSVTGSGLASLSWTPLAAETATAEQLRNGRLRIGDQVVYLRTPTQSASVRLDLAQPRQTEQWLLAAQPDPRHSRTSISAANGAEGDGEPLLVRWLNAAEENPARQVRALAEIRAEEESPVAVRVRLDVQRGRRLELEALSVATIEPTAGWQSATRDAITAAQERVDGQRLEIQRMLEVVRQRRSIADGRQLKRALRRQQEVLEHQQEVMSQWTERLAALQVMLARIASEIEWQIQVHTEWPDERQPIFLSDSGV